MKAQIPIFAAALCAAGFAECPQTVNDAGDVAWAHQAIPFSLGRKARGTAELDAVANLVSQHGRMTVADAFFQEPEFVDYWATAMVDMLGVRKQGFLSQPSGCFNTTAIDPSDIVSLQSLATHLRTAAPSVPFTIGGARIDWTMGDAMRAAIVDDDLTVAYLAYLPALVTKQRDLTANQASAISDQFREHYLERNSGCVSCHSSHMAHTDDVYQANHGYDVWDRHFTSSWNLESSVLAGPSIVLWTMNPPQPHKDRYTAGSSYFSANCSGCHGSTASTLMNNTLKLRDRVPVMTDDEIIGAIGKGFMTGVAAPAGADKTNLLAYLRHRYGDFDALKRFFQKTSIVVGGANRPWNMSSACAEEIVPYTVPSDKPPVDFAGSARRSADVTNLITDLRTGLDGLPAEVARNPGDASLASHELGTMLGKEAFAMMVARRAANAVMKETYSGRLIVDNGFSRNWDQAAAHAILTDAMIVVGTDDRVRISLRTGLKQIMVAPQFNQLPPSQASGNSYPFSMYLNPWAADESGTPDYDTGVNTNGQGDNTHRFSATNLLWSTRDSLGWGEPTWFPLQAAAGPAANEYPRRDYVEQIGGRISDDLRGSDIWEQSSLLYWESVAGTCGLTTSGVCVPSRSGDCLLRDWIDDIMSAASTAVVAPPVTLRDMLESTRDRLLSDPVIPADEVNEINASLLPPATTLSSAFPSDPVARDAWGETLRHYCGALMTSPQYAMAGLVTVTATTPGLPRLVVCQAGGELCSEHDLCTMHAGYIGAASTCP